MVSDSESKMSLKVSANNFTLKQDSGSCIIVPLYDHHLPLSYNYLETFAGLSVQGLLIETNETPPLLVAPLLIAQAGYIFRCLLTNKLTNQKPKTKTQNYTQTSTN